MISVPLARALRTAGLRWRPLAGDAYLERGVEADPVRTWGDLESPPAPAAALWLPREDQLRGILRDGFEALRIDDTAEGRVFLVTAVVRGTRTDYEAQSAADAYGQAVLDLVIRSLADDDDGGPG